MAFMQIIEFKTSDVETIRNLDAEWDHATEGKRTARREILTRDRNNPDRYLTFVFFDSYESAMENSNLPETQAMAKKYAAAVDGAPIFHDLDVLDDRAL